MLSSERERSVEKRERLILSCIEGGARGLGVDAYGHEWIEFSSAPMAMECAMCGKTIDKGWLRVGGETKICPAHVEFR